MATYVYETTDPARPRRRLEIRQSMRDPVLTHDPDSGEPIARVITGGYGYVGKSRGVDTRPTLSTGGGGCGAGCGCH